MMPALDRNVLEQWAEHGVPYDQATCGNAAGVARAALDEIDRLNQTIDELLPLITEETP